MKMLIALLIVPAIALAQSIPSPAVSRTDAPIVIADYLGYEPRPEQVAVWAVGNTSSVISAWTVTNAIPTWASLFSGTNIAAARLRRAVLSTQTSKWTREQRFDFEIHFDMENRMRAQESLGAITRQQYFNALNTVWTNTP